MRRIYEFKLPSSFSPESAPSPVSEPRDMGLSLLDIFSELLTDPTDTTLFSFIQTLLTLSKESITSLNAFETLIQKIQTLRVSDFERFIHLLHLTLYLQELSSENRYQPDVSTLTPIKESIQTMLSHFSVKEALKIFPYQLIDVLTAHPVDMDRGLILEFKREIEEYYRQWYLKKEAYLNLKSTLSKQNARTELDLLNQSLRNSLSMVLNTPNYRELRIKPESEQRTLSRSIKNYDSKLSAHWSKIVGFVQEYFLEAMAKELLVQTPELTDLSLILNKPRSDKRFRELLNCHSLIEHPCYAEVIALKNTLHYRLHSWRGDMDGNPYVTGTSIAKSIAYARVRSFEELRADDAVIRYRPTHSEFQAIEDIMKRTLSYLKQKGLDSWKRYIKERLLEEWSPAQIYSGLTYFRLVEMKEAAETFLRNPSSLSLLSVGFKDAEEFLSFSLVLEQAEEHAGIQDGTWTQLRKRVTLRDLTLGLPHARKGESFHFQLVSESLSILLPKQFSHPQTFLSLPVFDQKKVLSELLLADFSLPLEFDSKLSSDSRTLFSTYLSLIEIRSDSILIQSDSGSSSQDVELSILIMKFLSKLLSHQGEVVVLCEDEQSMTQAIQLMKEKDTAFFNRVIMMCAGSDNQKKLGPFYSASLNHHFLQTAYQNHIKAFFGVGDSPLRSSCYDPICSLKTFQPGSRKQFFFGDMIYRYLSHRLSNQIYQRIFIHTLSPETNALYEQITLQLCDSFYSKYKHHLAHRHTLHQTIQSMAEIVTTYFSRPSKKYAGSVANLENIRAIDSARAQLILNTFDPQLAGLSDACHDFLSQIESKGISLSHVHTFFNTTPLGQGLLSTLSFYASHLDDSLEDPLHLKHVSAKRVRDCYLALSGQELDPYVDPYLRLARLIWRHADSLTHSNAPTGKDLRPIAMLLFGANWMI